MATEAAVAVDVVVDPHKLAVGEEVEGDPLQLVVGEGEAAGEGGGVGPLNLVVEGEAVAVLATVSWSPKAGGLTLVARSSGSSGQSRNCKLALWGPAW